MKNIIAVLLLCSSLTAAYATVNDISADDQTRLIELDQQELTAYKKLQNAEQDALNGKISEDELDKVRNHYDQTKNQLEQALSKLPNKTEVEQWLIDQHSRGCQ